MTWWPGWDSIESTANWSHFWFWFGILCLFALGASEVVSHVYGLRKDELVAVAEVANANKRKTEQDAADARHTAEIGGLKEQLSEADKKLAEIERLRAARHLTADQKTSLAAVLAGKPIGKLVIKASVAAPDASNFGNEIAAVFKSAGWSVPVENAMFMGGDTSGIWITVRNANIPVVANVVYDAFKEANIPIRDGALGDVNGPAADEAWLKIGSTK